MSISVIFFVSKGRDGVISGLENRKRTVLGLDYCANNFVFETYLIQKHIFLVIFIFIPPCPQGLLEVILSASPPLVSSPAA